MMPCRICDVSTEARRAQPSGKWVRAACRSCNSIQQRVSTYGCTWEDANAPKPADGRCEICARDVPLEWDHDHATGRFRAWLCRHCNAGLMVWVDNLRSAGIADDAMRSMLATALDTYRRPDHV